MRKLQKKAAIKFAAACTLLLFSIISCEIGLGGAVDTQAPSLTIDSPKVDAVIRDVFAISGRWSDDGTIDSLNVTLKRTDGSFTTPEIKGEWIKDEQLNETGTWHAVIDYKELSIPDGTYQATVSIKDKGHHETTQSTTFTIDNTAPVLIVSRPSTKEGAKGFDSYGRSFTLEGKAADDNEVSLIEVNIYETPDSTEPLKTVRLENVPLTIEQDVATYDSALANDYAKIYGHTDENGIITEIGKTEQRYCTITIYDGAEKYPADGSAQTEEDKKGNSTNVYYMNSEISSLLQGKYKITDLYHIKNGTYKTEAARSAEMENVQATLEANQVTKSKFSINPANNPKFIVTSGNVLEAGKDLDDVNYQLTAGNRYIEVEVSPGLDGWPIDPDSVGIYLQACDKNGNELNDEKIWLVLPDAEHHIEIKEAENITTFNEGDAVYSQSGNTYKFKTANLIHKLNYNVNVGSYYIIKVVGHDSQDDDSGTIISDGTYAFKLVSNEEKIELSVHGVPDYISKTQAAWNVEGHKQLKTTVTWSTGDGPFDVWRKIDDEETGAKVGTVEEQTNSIWQFEETFNYTQFKALALAGKEFPEKISYILKNSTGDVISTTARIILNYDITEPSLSNIQFIGSYEKEVETGETDESGNPKTKIIYYVRNQANNLCTISGIATDDTGIESVALDIPGYSTAIPLQKTGRFKFTDINFTGLSDLTANIIATDVAGNQTPYPLEIIFDTTPPHGVHAIDASSKNLYLRVGNNDNDDIDSDDDLWDDAYDKGVGGKYGNGTFGNATTIQIRGNFSDDDGSGVAMIYYKVYTEEHLLSTDPTTAAQEIATLKAEVLADPTGHFAPLATPETKRVFYNVTDPSDTDQTFGGTQFTNTPNSKGYYKYYKNIESTFNETITGFKEGHNYLVFVAVDKVGNSAVDAVVVNFEGQDTTFVNYSLNVDITPPSNIKTLSSTGIIYTNKTEVPSLWGTVSDKTEKKYEDGTPIEAAGIRSFELSRDGVNKTLKATLREIRTEPKDGQPADSAELITAYNLDHTLRIWEVAGDKIKTLLPDTDGTVSISASVTDDAGVGNTTPGVVATITVDTKAPTVTRDANSPSDADTITAGTQVNGIISLAGTADEDNGIDELVGLYYKTYEGNTVPSASDSGWTAVDATKSGTTNWKFTDINTAKLDGTNEIADNKKVAFTVAVKDKAGNTGYSTPVGVIVNQDTDRPIITLSQLKNDATTYTIKTKNVYGSVKDDDGSVKKIWYWSKKLKNNAAPEEAPQANNDNGWTEIEINGNSWSVDSEETDGETTWYFAVEDNEDKIFWTGDESALNRPYIQYKETSKTDNSEGVTFKYDTNPPAANSLELYRAATETSITAEDISAQNNIPWSNENKLAFGGQYDVLYAKVVVNEGTGMNALTGDDDEEPETSPIVISYTNSQGKSLICNQIYEVADGETYTYYLGPLVMDTTEECTFNVTVIDAVGNMGYISREIIVDNTAPTQITNVKPAKGSPESGVVNFRGGVNDNEGGSGILLQKDEFDAITAYGLEWFIPTKAQSTNLEPSDIDDSDWRIPTTPGASSWEIEFENLGETIGYNSETYGVSGDYAGYETAPESGLYEIPVWFRLTDMVGNVGYNTTNAITYNPNADRPTVEFTYPTHNKTLANGLEYVDMGGTITITGMANDDDGISAVYLQFDMDGDDSNSYENAIVNGAYTAEDVVDIPGTTEKGILVTGTKSWYYTMSVSGISNLNAETNGKTMNVRAIAVENDPEKPDNKQLVSAWTKNVLHISVNNNVPNFSNIKLKQFASTPTSDTLQEAVVLGEQNYISDMYIKGDELWYLVGDVEVSSNTIKKVTATTGNTTLGYTAGGGANNTLIAYLSDGNKKCTFAVPIVLNDNATTGQWKTELYVEDATSGTPSTNRYPVSIHLDNTAPDFADTEGNLIVLYKNAYGNSGVKISEESADNFVQNYEGMFTLAGKITENGSGFDKLVFYFERTGSQDRIYNPMEKHGPNNDLNRVYLSDSATLTHGEVAKNHDGLPVLYLTGVTRDNAISIESGSLKNNKNIRVGGLVKIGGIYRLIDNVDDRDTTGTITFTPSCEKSFTTAEFVYGMVIDNNGESLKNDGTIKGDDHDRLLEGFTKAGINTTWDAAFDSRNIPDGPIEIHCVVFDVAGNTRHGYTKTKVSNNPPRLTSLKLGTDLNSDDTYTLSSEFTQYFANVNHSTKTGKETWNLNTKDDGETGSYWIAKKGLVVIPEFVGGTGQIYYRYDKYVQGDADYAEGVKAAKTGTLTGTPTLAQLLDSSSDIEGTLEASQDENKVGAIILTTADNDSLTTIGTGRGENKTNLYTFSFWDSTEECTVGQDTQWALLNVWFDQDLVDNTPPEGTITPFYWNNSGENSLYENSTLNGHIELASDLQGNSNFTDANGENDKDPKVSGKIRIEGTVFDETLLDTITLTFDNKSVTATYQKQSKNWTYRGNSDSFNLAITQNGPTQAGHSETWTYTVDTAAIDDVAKEDVSITMAITDASSNAGSSSPYRVDVVPYITKVYTALGKLKNNEWSVYNRTANGHYPVSADETIYLYGFNLGNGTKLPEFDGNSLVAPTNGADSQLDENDNPLRPSGAAYSTYKVVSLPVSAITHSGEIALTVSGVSTLNNKNTNDSKGSYAGSVSLVDYPTGNVSIYNQYYYNRQPNGDNNNLLTDDVEIDIWEINPQAVVPISGVTSQPVMAINPVNHDVGFAFVNGALYYSMPNGNSYSYDNFIGGFDYWTSVAMTYDSLGNSYGTAAGGDINETKADQLKLLTSRWGYADRDAGGYNTATNNLRLELIGQFDYMYNGTSYDGFRNFDKERIRSPSIATGSASNTSTNVYLAYYDAINDEIRFKKGEIKASKAATWNNLSSAQKTASFFGDYYGPSGSEAGDKVLADGNDYSKYRLVHNSWLAGQTSRVYDTSGNTRDTQVITTSGKFVYAGQYVSIAAIPGGGSDGDDAVVAVWWDATNNQLLYSYNLTPNSITVGQYKQADTKWTTPVPIFDSDIGEYCKLAFIKEGTGSNTHYSVHIVGYDGLNCDVWYAYIPNFTDPPNDTSTIKTCLVDSYGLIGTELNIDVALDSSGNPVPYISYYAGSCAHPKTAHWVGTTSIANAQILNGVDNNEYFTGVWEVSVIPTRSRVSIDHVNIGVWKDSDGVITWSTTDGLEPNGSNTGETKLDYKEVYSQPRSGGSNTGYRTGGHVYGNGTKNPILGYAITNGASGYIETAQMK